MAMITKLECKSFAQPDEVQAFPHDSGHIRTCHVGGHTIGVSTFRPGWRWSRDIREVAGTDLCMHDHVIYVLDGEMCVRMADGQEVTAKAGDCLHVPPGHDAWVVGEGECRAIDFAGAEGYAVAS